jgi:hypothetical protein
MGSDNLPIIVSSIQSGLCRRYRIDQAIPSMSATFIDGLSYSDK